jgi:hypothetical protein
MALSFIKVAVKKSTGLRKILHKQLAGPEPGRSFKNLHASDVTHPDYQFCARERAYQLRYKKPPANQMLSTSENVTFDIGRFVEKKVIDTFADAGMVIGDWKCRHCGVTAKLCKRPSKCQECGHHHFKHVEQRVLSDLTGISCGLDVLLQLPMTNLLTVVEVKSIDKDEFKTLVAAKAEHSQRTKLYLKCAAESSQPVAKLIRTDQAFVLYVSKGGYGVSCEEVMTWDFWDSPFSPFKEYLIERDDESLEKILQQPMILQAWLKQWEEDGEPPEVPDRICSSSLDKRAKKCSCLSPCFIKTLKFGKAKEG